MAPASLPRGHVMGEINLHLKLKEDIVSSLAVQEDTLETG